MSPDLIGVIVGVLFIVPTMYVINTRGFDAWAWPIFLASLPVYYMLFGVLAMDGEAIGLELLYGLPYFFVAWMIWKLNFRLAWLLLAIAWISHGFYDYYHDSVFINPGVFSWYPAFCALVDIAVGTYLLFSSALKPSS